jgi:CheY-like chemotaxis protein
MTDTGCAKTVLIVEDDSDTRSALAEVLEDGNYRLIIAENGKVALQELRAATSPPCLILLDVMMPVMDGKEFRLEQEKDPVLRTIPVVVLSAHADAVASATQMGAAGFLKKPVDLADLLRTVEQFCTRE